MNTKKKGRIWIRKCKMKWEILNSSYPFKNKWLTVRKDKVKMPSGYEMDDFYVLEYPNFVNVIAITKDNRFIIEEQYRHGIQQITYELCAGGCEEGESPIQTAKRELLEETGYSGGKWLEYMQTASDPNSRTSICTTFIATGVEKVQIQSLEKSEDIKIHLLSINDIEQLLIKGKIIEGVMQSALWRYIYENKNK